MSSCGRMKKRDPLEDLDVDGMIILRLILERDRMGWYVLMWLRIGNNGGLL
jgi:hypothetical protein